MILEPLSAFKGCQAQSRYHFLFSQLQVGLITNHVEAAVLVLVFVVVLSDNASLLVTNHARGSAAKILTMAPIVLFMREGFVAKLRERVEHEGDFSKYRGGLEFREFMRGVVYPMCIHSQAAERGVNASVNTNIAYDTSRSGEVTSAKTSSMFSFRYQHHQAGAEYIAERLRAQAAVAEAEAEYQTEIIPSAI